LNSRGLRIKIALTAIENINAVFINEGMEQAQRLAKLNAIAITEMELFAEDLRPQGLKVKTNE
jgi:hypothetical protein